MRLAVLLDSLLAKRYLKQASHIWICMLSIIRSLYRLRITSKHALHNASSGFIYPAVKWAADPCWAAKTLERLTLSNGWTAFTCVGHRSSVAQPLALAVNSFSG